MLHTKVNRDLEFMLGLAPRTDFRTIGCHSYGAVASIISPRGIRAEPKSCLGVALPMDIAIKKTVDQGVDADEADATNL